MNSGTTQSTVGWLSGCYIWIFDQQRVSAVQKERNLKVSGKKLCFLLLLLFAFVFVSWSIYPNTFFNWETGEWSHHHSCASLVFPASPAPSHTPTFSPPLRCNRRRQWHPTPVFLPGKSHGGRSLEGCSPGGRWGSDTTERLHFHFSLSCIGEGNGNPLQCSCLENPRDGGTWWAAVYGVAQSWTRLKWLSNMQCDIYIIIIIHKYK